MREKYIPYIAKVSPLSLKLKLSLITIALLSIVILSISVTFFINGKRILKERILSDLVALVDAKADRIINLVELNCEQAEMIASRRFLRLAVDQMQKDPLTSKKQAKEIVEVLLEIVESVKFVEGIDIIGVSGKIIISSTPENIGKDEASSKSFLEGKKDLYLADLYMEGDSLMYYISVPILRLGETVEEEPIAVLKMNMEARRLLNLLTDYTGLGETGEIELGTISNENILFINPLRHRFGAEQQLTTPLKGDYAEPMEKAVKKQDGMMVGLDYRGVEVLAAYRYISVGNWGAGR